MRRLLPILIFAAAGSCVACDPPPPEPTFPIQNGVHAEGNSVMFQTYYNSGLANPFDTSSFEIGASARYAPSGYPAVERIPTMVAQGNVGILVWDLGLNEIFRAPDHVWHPADQDVWLDILMNQIPPETCVVMVQQWVLPAGNNVRPLQSMNELRGWVEALQEIRPNTIVVDWKPILEAHPEYAPLDGAHKAPQSGAAEARDQMYRTGIENCG